MWDNYTLWDSCTLACSGDSYLVLCVLLHHCCINQYLLVVQRSPLSQAKGVSLLLALAQEAIFVNGHASLISVPVSHQTAQRENSYRVSPSNSINNVSNSTLSPATALVGGRRGGGGEKGEG